MSRVKSKFRIVIDHGQKANDQAILEYRFFGAFQEGIEFIAKHAYTSFLKDRRPRRIVATIEDEQGEAYVPPTEEAKKPLDRTKQYAPHALGRR